MKSRGTLLPFYLIFIPSYFEQMHIVIVLLLRFLTQKPHFIVHHLQRFLLSCQPGSGSAPPFCRSVGTSSQVRHAPAGRELLEVVVARTASALGFYLHELLLDLVCLVDLAGVLFFHSECQMLGARVGEVVGLD